MINNKYIISYAAGTLLAVQSVMAQERPNVVIIMTDEHNFRTLGCYRELLDKRMAFPWGEENFVETPNIDALAHSGALCTNCYATNPVSSPSRSSFMTGLYPQSTGVDKNDKVMKDEMITFSEVLSKNGYSTAYFGKWHLDGPAKPGWTPKRKFGWEDNLFMYNRGHWKKLAVRDGKPMVAGFNQKGKSNEGALSNADEKSFTTDFLTDRAIQFIKDSKNKQFCCFISIPDPHGPNIVRKPYDNMYSHMKFDRPESAYADTTGMPSWTAKSKRTIIDSKQGMSQYFGMVKCIDDNVGKLCDFLKNEGLYDNTLIIFTSDHGDLLGEHGRDNKSVPFEASAKVPYIWSYPKGISKKVVATPISNADFSPTLLGFLDLPFGQKYHGKDRSDLFKGKRNDYDDVVVFKSMEWLAATDGRYKLIYTNGDGNSPVLYDLKSDPNEINNIYGDKKRKNDIRRLSQSLKEYCLRCEEPLWKSMKIQNDINDGIGIKK